jgi:hypothetical protein
VTSKFTPYLKEEQTRIAIPPKKTVPQNQKFCCNQSINQSKPLTTKVLQSFKESLMELFLWGLGSLK